MAKRKSKPTLALESEGPVRYRLVFETSEDGKRVSNSARLTSRLLDRDMHGRRGARVYFRSVEKRRPGTRFKLDPFEVASLTAYLDQQPEVRRQLEDELLNFHDWDPGPGGIRAEVWKETTIDAVVFGPRFLASPTQAAFLRKKYKGEAKRLLEVEFDTPDTLSSFEVDMVPEWGGSHMFTFIFRDGRCLEHRMEG